VSSTPDEADDEATFIRLGLKDTYRALVVSHRSMPPRARRRGPGDDPISLVPLAPKRS
jgi:hypothetical protein